MSFEREDLSAPIQVAGHGTIGNKVALFIAVAGLVAAAAVMGHDKQIAALILIVALVVLLSSLTIALKRWRRRAWILVAKEGFVYRDRQSESSYADDQVVGVNVISKSNYRQGVLKSHTKQIEFKVAERATSIKMVTTTKLDQFDPLAGLLARTIENYCDRAEMALDAGARLSGAGWSLGRDDLAAEGKDATRAMIADLVAIDTVDDEHKIWRTGQDAPMLSVPIKSENAFLLSLLLAPKIAEASKDREFDLAQPGLGRQIFQRTSGRFGRGFGWCCIAFSVLAIPLMMAALAAQEPTLMALSLAGLFLAPLALLLGLFLLRNEFKCHERGVFRRSFFKQQELRFEDVESFKYNAVRQYYNGAYSGTSLEVVFLPTPSSGKKKLRYSRMVQNADEALEGLREHVTNILMPKMAKTLSESGNLQWMPNVRITQDGFFYRPKGFVSRKEEQFLSFADVSGFNIDEGTFHVWKKGADKSVIHELTSEPNFYPGFLLLTIMYGAAAREEGNEDSEEFA